MKRSSSPFDHRCAPMSEDAVYKLAGSLYEASGLPGTSQNTRRLVDMARELLELESSIEEQP